MDGSGALKFGNFELHADQRRLLRGGEPVAVGARAFDLLLALTRQRDRVVTKSELLDVVWPGLVVEENNLQVQISSLRKLLGPQAIATIPGRGYRFAAMVNTTAVDGPLIVAPSPPQAEMRDDAQSASPTNLPAMLPALYGRDADLAALRALIDEHPLVTVVGAGGIGKSRLAQAAAQALSGRRPDGAWMVELAGLSDPALLPNAVAQALGIKLTGSGTAHDALVASLAQREMLLVLDNCEHLLDAAAAMAQAILQGAPKVRLLTTSQEPLHLPVEQQFRVMPLPVPADAAQGGVRDYGAIALFQARVRAVDPRFELSDDNLPVVIDICRRLDGLPLAIELAAARVATLGLRPVRDKLDARFRLLTAGSRATLRRHQTLRAALEWSHNLLDGAERAVFRRLGVFAGGFTMELAQAVAADAQLDEWAVLDRLSALVDKSLVVADAGDPPRYRLLESARAFALEHLPGGEMDDVLERHALAMLEFLKRTDDANLDGELRTDQYAALVLPELDNLRAAHAWSVGGTGDPQVAVGLAAHAGALIDYALECADWLLSLPRQVDDNELGPAVAARYWRAMAAGNMISRVPLAFQVDAAARAAQLYRTLGQPRRVFSSLMQLSRHRGLQQGDVAAQAALDEARALMRPDWPAEFRIMLLRRDGVRARNAGRLDEALAIHRDAVHASAAAGDWRLEVIARANLVDLLWEAGPIDEAAREACALADALRARPATDGDMDVHFANVVGILSEMGRLGEAVTAARDALPIMRRSRHLYVEGWAYLFWRRGQHAVAALLLGTSDAELLRAEAPLQLNEARLMAAARAGLEAQLAPEALAKALADGARLDVDGVFAVIEEALAQEPGDAG